MACKCAAINAPVPGRATLSRGPLVSLSAGGACSCLGCQKGCARVTARQGVGVTPLGGGAAASEPTNLSVRHSSSGDGHTLLTSVEVTGRAGSWELRPDGRRGAGAAAWYQA